MKDLFNKGLVIHDICGNVCSNMVNTKDERVVFRATYEEWIAIKRKSLKAGKTASAWIRETLLKATKEKR